MLMMVAGAALCLLFGLTHPGAAGAQDVSSPSGDLEVTIVDLDGNPLEGYQVQIFSLDEDSWYSGYTAADGVARFEGIEAKQYVVDVSSPTWSWLGNGAVTVAADILTTIEIPVAPIQYGDLEVEVVDGFGNPLVGVDVALTHWSTGNLWAMTDTSGVAHFSGVPADTYNAYVWNPVAGDWVADYDVTVVANTTNQITLTVGSAMADGQLAIEVVDGSGEPVGGATVTVMTYTTEFSGISDTEGIASFGGLAPGNYSIVVTSADGTLTVSDWAWVSVGSTTWVEVRLAPSRLSVEVVDEWGAPVGGATVTVLTYTTEVSGHTDGDGIAEFEGLAPGSYPIVVTSADGTLTTQDWVWVYTGWPTSLTVVLAPPAFGTLDVTVVDTGGNPLPGYEVEIYGSSTWRWADTDVAGLARFESVPIGNYDVGVYDFDGHFLSWTSAEVTKDATTAVTVEVTLPARISGTIDVTNGSPWDFAVVVGGAWASIQEDGSYSIVVSPGVHEVGLYRADLPTVLVESRSVTVAAEQTAVADFSVDVAQLPAAVRGTARYDDGMPLGDVPVELRQGTAVVATATTAGDGSFTMYPVAPGTYVVWVGGSSATVTVIPGQVSWAAVAVSGGTTASCSAGTAPQPGLTNMGFETGDLSGWTTGTLTQGIEVVGADGFATPWEGSKMARLASSASSSGHSQPPGPNVLCQDFVVDEPTETFAFNLFTYDYTGYDRFAFDIIVTSPSTGELLATLSQQSWGQGTELKTSGWRGVTLDLSGHEGETVRFAISAGGTSDSLYTFWAYLDSAAELPPELAALVQAEAPGASVMVDPSTGQSTVSMPSGNVTDVTLSFTALCADGATPTSVSMLLNGAGYPAGQVGSSSTYVVMIPQASVQSGILSTQVNCPDAVPIVTKVGEIVLYDPSGIVSDALTGEPVVGATVTLYQVPGWSAAPAPGTLGATECQSNLSKPADAPWSQPAPVALGVEANPASGLISPKVNPFITNSIGYYGWDVAAGCWYVVVSADGYQLLTSPVVGVPTEVTDLDLELTPLPPSAPSGVAATAGVRHAQVSWTASEAGLAPVTGYTVTASPGGATVTVAAGASSATVEGLADGGSYTFSVLATSAVGNSATASSPAVVLPDVPGAPTGAAATADVRSATVSWVAPVSDGGRPVTGYTATAAPGGATCTTSGLSCAIDGLVDGGSYTFSVVATNVVGNSPAGSSPVVALPDVAGAPTAVTAIGGNKAATVSWIAPVSDGGRPVSGYTATAAPGGATCTSSGLSCTITGLTNGTSYTFTVVATTVVGTSAPSVASAAVVPADPTACGAGRKGPFKDVPGSHAFCGEVEWLANTKVTVGYSDGTFGPNRSVNRGAMAAFLYRYAGSPPVTLPAKPTFKDVPKSHGFHKEIEWLASTGLTTGYSDGTYGPDRSITRGAMAVFFYRFAESPAMTPPVKASFKDVPKTHAFSKQIEWFVTTKVTTGYSDSTYRPNAPVTRGAFAAFLYRFDRLGA